MEFLTREAGKKTTSNPPKIVNGICIPPLNHRPVDLIICTWSSVQSTCNLAIIMVNLSYQGQGERSTSRSLHSKIVKTLLVCTKCFHSLLWEWILQYYLAAGCIMSLLFHRPVLLLSKLHTKGIIMIMELCNSITCKFLNN